MIHQSTKNKRRVIWERDQGICGICREPVAFDRCMHLDHIIPRSFGGGDNPENLQATHKECNRLKGYQVSGYLTTTEAAKRLGWSYSLLISRIQWNGIQTRQNEYGTHLISLAEVERIETEGWKRRHRPAAAEQRPDGSRQEET